MTTASSPWCLGTPFTAICRGLPVPRGPAILSRVEHGGRVMGLVQSIADRIRTLRKPVGTLQGYENPALVELIFEKTKAYSPEGEWSEMTGVSTVFDFG